MTLKKDNGHHVVHILTRWMLAGSEENTLETCIGQVEAGYKVTILYGQDSDPRMLKRIDPRITVVCEPSLVHPIHPVQDVRAVFRIKHQLQQWGATIVHTHQSKAGIIGRVAARLAGTPCVIHGVHIVPFQNAGRFASAFYSAVERMLARYTDCFIHVSAGVRQMYLDQRIGPGKRHEVIYSGMPLDRFMAPQAPTDWRTLLRVDEDAPKPPVVVMLAALEPRKRHIELIESFAAVAEAVPGARLLMAGGGDDSYGPVVQQAIAASKHSSQINFVGHRTDPWSIIALADVCVLCSVREGLPRVVVQYITAGRPAVVSHLDGIDEIVKHGKNGVITPGDDVSALCSTLVDILKNRTELQRLSEGAANTDTSPWTIAAMRNRSNQVYAELAAHA